MKRISKGYWLACALLLLWAAADVYHYATAGRDMISYYESAGMLWRLVHHRALQGAVKALLGCLILLIGWRRGKRDAGMDALTAVTALLALAALGTWGVSMYCLTAASAEYAAARYLTTYGDFASILATRSFGDRMDKEYDRKYANYNSNRMWEAVDTGGRAESFSRPYAAAEGRSGFLRLPDGDRVYSAAAVYDGAGNLLACSWEDFFYFEYLTEAQWKNRQERSGNNARACFDRDLLTEAGREMAEDGNLTFDARALRFTGSFDGVDFTPRKIEAIDWDTFDEAMRAKGGGSYTVSGVVQDNNLPWITLYENPQAAQDSESITLYSDWFEICCDQPSPAFSYNALAYDDVGKLVGALGPALADGAQMPRSRYEGRDLILPSVNYCFTLNGETYYTPYYGGQAAYAEGSPQVHFYIVSAVYCSPWRTAGEELRYVYLLTFLLAAVLILVGRAVIRRRLIDPVQQIGAAMGENGISKIWRRELPQGWRECRQLRAGFEKYDHRLQLQESEITRLNTALDYAKTAEENRRQMTSNIAHELKTPLAVIHSYAEGLKEHVAEEKREKYLDVILSEAERTDAMVLEMLDLSRLEAGKVKLAREDFSLAALTRSVFEKLEMAARAKDLQIDFDFPEDFAVTADEGRIAQVIENFASNAVKYTPQGGHVQVAIRRSGAKTVFTIENDSAPLSDEVLDKVWNTFYRADESRSGGGTGLGLAIAKSIVELHGGTCDAYNTATGVAFRFTI